MHPACWGGLSEPLSPFDVLAAGGSFLYVLDARNFLASGVRHTDQ